MFGYILAGLVILLFSIYFAKRDNNSLFSKSKTILVVTAHPDDECMFFGPVITHLVNKNARVHVFCLTTGNKYSQGHQRKQEFYKSCNVLGLNSNESHILNDHQLPDGPENVWDQHYLRSIISKVVCQHQIDTVITFDGYGVSGHQNHIALYAAVKQLHIGQLHRYSLVSVNLIRKYLSVFDIILAFALNESLILTPPGCLHKPYFAMFEHKSQLLWFRYLYILSSRYMFLNSFTPIE